MARSRTSRGFSLASAGARAAGFSHASSIIRASRVAIGSGADAGASLSTLAATAGGVGVALGGLMVASKLVEAGFGALSDAAMTVVGAIAQIGGARGLQSMLVEAAGSERMSADIAANSADKISQADVMQVLTTISSNTEYSKDQMGEMARAFVGKRGNFGEFKELSQFTADLASVATLKPDEAGAIMGQLRVQFPELSLNQTKEAAANLWSLGKQGAVELKDTQSITQALGFARAVSPDALAGMGLEMGMVQAAQRFTGGQSADEAVTGVRRLQEQLLSDETSKKGRALHQLLNENGQDYLTHDETGRAVIRNAPRTFAKIALGAFEDRPGMSEAIESRSAKALRGFVSGDVANQFVGADGKQKSESDKIAILEDVFKKMENTGSHLEEFNGALKIVKDTAEYQLKQQFNLLANEMEEKLLPVFKEMIPVIRTMVQQFIDNKDNMVTGFIELVSWIKVTAEVFPQVVMAAIGLFNAFSVIAKGIISIIPRAALSDVGKTIYDTLDSVNPINPEDITKHRKQIKDGIDKDLSSNKELSDIQAKNRATGNTDPQAIDKTYEGIKDKVHKEQTAKDSKTFLQILEANREVIRLTKEHIMATKDGKNPVVPPHRSENGH